MRGPKVLVLVPYLGGDSPNGALRTFRTLARVLAEKGADVTLAGQPASLTWSGLRRDWVRESGWSTAPPGVDVMTLRTMKRASQELTAARGLNGLVQLAETSLVESPILEFLTTRRIKKLRAQLGPRLTRQEKAAIGTHWDLVISGWAPFRTIEYGREIAKRSRAHHAVMPNLHAQDHIHVSSPLRSALASASSILTMSNDELPEQWGLENRSYRLGGIAQSWPFTQQDQSDVELIVGDRRYVLVTTPIGAGAKNRLATIRTIAETIHPKLSVVAVGSGWGSVHAPNIIGVEYVSHGALDILISRATAVVVPSCFESYSYLMVDAMAHGVIPIVNRASSAMRSIASESSAALLASTPAEFASAANAIASDTFPREQMQEFASQWTRRYASTDAFHQAVDHWLDEECIVCD